MPANRPNKELKLHRELEAWDLRCSGHTHARIALKLGLTRRAVGLILDRVERRELRRLAESVERQKVTQTGQLEHIIDETLEAWRASKEPRNRVVAVGPSPKAEDVEKTEVIDQTGDCRHLHAAMAAMDRLRDLWGLNVMAASQETASSISQVTRAMSERVRRFEARQAEAAPPGSPAGADAGPGGGAGPLPG